MGWAYGRKIIGHVGGVVHGVVGVVHADVGVVHAEVGHGAGGEEEDESGLELAELRRRAHLHGRCECC